MKKTLKIIKIGGGVIEDPEALQSFCKSFAALKGDKILIHGGGKSATLLAEKLGVKTQMIQGRRLTPQDSLEVICMSYAGTANKTIVSCLQSYNCNALGLSGTDGNTMLAEKRAVKEIDYGFVGDISAINSGLIVSLLNLGLSPVFCALTHDGQGQLLNTNADSIAAAIATSMAAVYDCSLWYCFEKEGVLSDIETNTLISELTYTEMEAAIADGSVHAGMIPKLHNGFLALKKGVHEVRIGNENLFHGTASGTQLKIR